MIFQFGLGFGIDSQEKIDNKIQDDKKERRSKVETLELSGKDNLVGDNVVA